MTNDEKRKCIEAAEQHTWRYINNHTWQWGAGGEENGLQALEVIECCLSIREKLNPLSVHTEEEELPDPFLVGLRVHVKKDYTGASFRGRPGLIIATDDNSITVDFGKKLAGSKTYRAFARDGDWLTVDEPSEG